MATSVGTEALVMDTLKATDRCDRCGAQAYVATDHSGLVLLWCAHHFEENEVKLIRYVVLDLRNNLHSADA
jgi:hypothetical protein